jgi:hypothetical protein
LTVDGDLDIDGEALGVDTTIAGDGAAGTEGAETGDVVLDAFTVPALQDRESKLAQTGVKARNDDAVKTADIWHTPPVELYWKLSIADKLALYTTTGATPMELCWKQFLANEIGPLVSIKELERSYCIAKFQTTRGTIEAMRPPCQSIKHQPHHKNVPWNY